jgi:predicted RNA binding protein YcfA (HicA-like mRNA interferase family)
VKDEKRLPAEERLSGDGGGKQCLTPHMTPFIIKKRSVTGMSKWNKLLEQISALSPDLRFKELQKVLESYGYTMYMPRSGSSHCTFRKTGCQPITIPRHNPIKRVYVELVKQIVESEESADENVR